ncbi:MAG: hypothetical protein GEU73_06120 [Chloroflexi bacterium]|nr:hypothetical protein [Chloroflexota bacterium]
MDLGELIQQVGLPVAMLILALITGARGDWAFGRELRELRARNDELWELLRPTLGVAQTAVDTIERERSSTRRIR